MSGVTKLDRIRNERIGGIAKVGGKKVRERSLKWHGHVLRREEECVGQENDGDRGAVEEKESKSEAQVFG